MQASGPPVCFLPGGKDGGLPQGWNSAMTHLWGPSPRSTYLVPGPGGLWPSTLPGQEATENQWGRSVLNQSRHLGSGILGKSHASLSLSCLMSNMGPVPSHSSGG